MKNVFGSRERSGLLILLLVCLLVIIGLFWFKSHKNPPEFDREECRPLILHEISGKTGDIDTVEVLKKENPVRSKKKHHTKRLNSKERKKEIIRQKEITERNYLRDSL